MTRYEPFSRGKCPHCYTAVRFEQSPKRIYYVTNEQNETFHVTAHGDGHEQEINIIGSMCPNCQNTIINLDLAKRNPDTQFETVQEWVVYPLSSGRPLLPLEVPENIAKDYNEAALVLPFSPKSSAALSRRCLQTLLRDAGGTKSKNLDKQIDEVLPHLPAYIGQNLDAVRHIGNFAAHEQKSTITSMILDVEPGEAEWNLDILDALFDFYYVKPGIERKKREEMNKKLQEAGKPTLKQQ